MDKVTIKEVFGEINGSVWRLKENYDYQWVFQSLEHILLYTESPIEKKFLIALMNEIVLKNRDGDLFSNPILIWTNEIEEIYPEDAFPEDKSVIIFINPQLEKYRPDILLFRNDIKIIFEVDGFQFHNTKEQLTHDKKRERELSKLGYKIYRFSGTEIHKDSEKIAKEALEIIYKEFNLS